MYKLPLHFESAPPEKVVTFKPEYLNMEGMPCKAVGKELAVIDVLPTTNIPFLEAGIEENYWFKSVIDSGFKTDSS